MALAVTPTGSISLALTGLETLLINAATFRDEVGTTSTIEASESVYFDYDEDNDQDFVRPYALVRESGAGYSQFAGGDRNHMKANGSVMLLLTANAKHPSHHKSSKITFLNFAGGVIDEIAALFGSDQFYPFRSIETLDPAMRTSPNDRSEGNDFWVIQFGLTQNA